MKDNFGGISLFLSNHAMFLNIPSLESLGLPGYDPDRRNAYRFHRSEEVQKELSKALTPEAIEQVVVDCLHEANTIEDVEKRINTKLKATDRLITCKGIGNKDARSIGTTINIDISKLVLSDNQAKSLDAIDVTPSERPSESL